MLTACSRNTLTPENTSSQNYFRQLLLEGDVSVHNNNLHAGALQQLLSFPETFLLHRGVLHTGLLTSSTFYFPLRNLQHLQLPFQPVSPYATVRKDSCKGYLPLYSFSSPHCPLCHVDTEKMFNFFHMFTSANTAEAIKANFGELQNFLILVNKRKGINYYFLYNPLWMVYINCLIPT